MNIIFTDIDGVLNPKWTKTWDRKCVRLYNEICDELDLVPVLSSTWRVKRTIQEMNQVFRNQGIYHEIGDFTPVLIDEDRGAEIDWWLRNNEWSNYCVIDDKVKGIVDYVGNVVEINTFKGIQECDLDKIREIFNK
jgi:hypothetical protein